ncbi:hypothetical protein NliqN6_1925 [Naganishia liquefaciens]|uniref:Uncharacterized protein n=1 Tax=Naganishia liquefaciens TaxID=104408 RepID=A0A8H3YDS5_9TREE|nr:hypothetical protein NliqN6_1925 [Naganishia liquefaciens]
MTDNKRLELISSVEAAMMTFTRERKDTFHHNLATQFELLSDNEAVVRNVVIKVKSLAELVTAIPVALLTPDVRLQVIGKREKTAKRQASEDIDERIRHAVFDIVGATYTALTAQYIYRALSLTLETQTGDGTELQGLISRAALAATPMEPQFNQAGVRERAKPSRRPLAPPY